MKTVFLHNCHVTKIHHLSNYNANQLKQSNDPDCNNQNDNPIPTIKVIVAFVKIRS